MTARKQPSSFRLSEECYKLIGRLAEALGISQAGVIEQAVRKLARSELPPGDHPPIGAPPTRKPGRPRKEK
jgi:hypothetical protein